jgi:two-component system response regulator AtoC
VLIQGATGTGKEVVARNIHAASARATGPFVAVNCSAIPRDLCESEFFGHKKGAFTGAQTAEIGKFRLAHQGTLLLDEIGDLTAESQAKLLRALEEHEFYPVGSTELVRVDTRILASTNKNLGDMVKRNQFREDLYFRLNIFTIATPPLSEHPEDIIPLCEHYMDLFNLKFGKKFADISPSAREALLKYSWPGNVRELRNLVERIVLSEEGPTLIREYLYIIDSSPVVRVSVELPESGIDLEEVEKQLILQALEKANGNKARAAKLLHLTAPTLYYRLQKFGLD